MIAEAVSKIGTPMMSSGTTRVMAATDFITPSSEMHASVKPRNIAPESPMKIDAGLKL